MIKRRPRRQQNFGFCFLCSLLWRSWEVAVIAWNFQLPGGRKVSFADGILRVQTEDLPKDLPTVPPLGTLVSKRVLESIQVRDTGTVKGFGAFCRRQPLEKYDFLGFYEGNVIKSTDEASSQDYMMSLDGGATFLDGFERALNRERFSPVHLNHCDKGLKGCNCIRLLEQQRVAFFTSREVMVGEELCFDYGDNFWRGREDEKV